MRLAILGVSLSLCMACSTSSSTSTNDAASPYVGTWTCTVNQALTFTAPPNTVPQSSTEPQALSIKSGGNGTFTATALTDSGPSCALKYKVDGSSAALDGNQTCTPKDLLLAYTQGSVTANGNALTASLTFTFSGTTAAADGGTATVSGSGTSAYSCTHQ